MSPLTEELLKDIDKNTVDFVPNYDNTREEPLVLPCAFPNFLVNGSQGIAVGMATNVPPHNLGEVIDGLMHLIDHPEATVKELIKFIQGPGFSHGRLHPGPRRHHRGLYHGPRKRAHAGQGRVETDKKDRETHHRFRASLPGQQGPAHRKNRRAGARQENGRHHRSAGRVRPRRHADRHRSFQERQRPGHPEQSFQPKLRYAHPLASSCWRSSTASRASST